MLICDPMVVVRKKGKEGKSRDVWRPYIPAIRRMAAKAQALPYISGHWELLFVRCCCVRGADSDMICAPGMSGMYFRNCAVLAEAQQGGSRCQVTFLDIP
jgi:hypothetical protein